jgi:hypothetical protein
MALSLLPVSINAQNFDKTVMWSGSSECGWKNERISSGDIYVCSSVPTDRGSVSVIEHNGIVLAAVFSRDGKFTTAAVQIVNKRSEALSFDSDLWGAAQYRSRAELLAGKQPLVAEFSIPSRDTARGIASRANSDNAADEYLASVQQTVQTVEIRQPDGTRLRVKQTVPDASEQEAAAGRSEARSVISERERERIRQNALTAKSVSPNSCVKGLVYFRRKRERIL